MYRSLTAAATLSVLALLPAASPPLRAAPPVALDDRLTVELIAQEPQLVTPTGVACDVRDNVWVIESNTHFPPKGYKGHPTDRIWVFSPVPVDGGGSEVEGGNGGRGSVGSRGAALGGGGGLVGDAASGKASATKPVAPTTPVAGTKQALFADGFQQAMSLTMTPGGRVYVTCRNEIVLFEDKDHDLKPDAMPAATPDGKAADRKVLVRLDTKATYPHNGLNAACLSPDGAYIYFCLGLNTGFDYTVVGSDGSKVAGGGEGGSIWRCTPDGGKVERVAIGFWNCHDLTFDAFGRLFAVDNDPDDIGPCRLLDIIDGGDYGWKFKNGRKGVHPFTSWDGRLPGTLPMVAPTGEAPSGVLAYESDDWPADYRGQLLVTSWGDHTVQRFELKEKGASFTSAPVDVVRGGEDFRPVGIAQAADGSVYVTDWVDKSYTLHGKGKLWRVRAKDATKAKAATKDEIATREPRGSAPGRRLRADEVAKLSADERTKLLDHPTREIRAAAGAALAAGGESERRNLESAVSSHLPGDHSIDRRRIQAMWSMSEGTPNRPRDFSLWDVMADADLPTAAAEAARTWKRRKGPGHPPRLAVVTPFETRWPPVLLREILLWGSVNENFDLRWDLEGKAPWLDDPFVATAALDCLIRSTTSENVQRVANDDLLAALAERRRGQPPKADDMQSLLGHRKTAVRRVALQWVGEDRLTQFAPNIADALKAGDVSRDLLAAYLACREKLETPPAEPGKPPVERSGRQFAAEFLFDEANDLALRKIALDLIDPADPKLPSAKLVALVKPMGVEAVKALAWRDDAEAQAALRAVAADGAKDADWRREAVAGLARSAAASADTKRVLLDLLFDGPPELRTDALRSLRGTLSAAEARRVLADLESAVAKPGLGTPADHQEWAEQVQLAVKATPDALDDAGRRKLAALMTARPTDTAGWQAAAKEGGDPDAGRRLFALTSGARCYVCHAANDRGGQVGPDLSAVGRAMDRHKLVESILEPSKEVAPLYVSNIIELKNGDTISGVGLPEAGAAYVSIADASGKRIRVKAEDIESRRTEKLSVMPDSLTESMTVREFRDLVAYLASLK